MAVWGLVNRLGGVIGMWWGGFGDGGGWMKMGSRLEEGRFGGDGGWSMVLLSIVV